MGRIQLKIDPFQIELHFALKSKSFNSRPYIMAGVLARPTGMKGHLMNTIKRNLGLATVFASVMTTGWYFWVVKSRKDAYTNFYKNLDADAMFERQKSKGVFYYNKDMEEGEEE